MASNTPNLNLYKKDPIADGNHYFDVQTMMNDNWDKIDAEFGSANIQPVTLSRGLQTIIADQNTPLWMKKIIGRTLVNLLGRDGNCEDVSKWNTSYSPTVTLDSANKVFGNNGFKITLTSTLGSIRPFTNPIQAGRYYILLADVKNGNATEIGTKIQTVGSLISDTTKFNLSYKKFYTDSIFAPEIIVYGSAGQYAYVDGVRLYEITQAEYNSLDSMTTEQIAAKYPYVDDVKGLQNPYTQVVGKNLLPPFTEWTLHANAKVVSPYELRLDTTVVGELTYVKVPVISGQSYKLSSILNSVDGRLRVRRDSQNGTELASIGASVSSTTVVIPSDVSEVYIIATNMTTGTFTFTNPQLELGTVATTFEAQRKQYVSLPTTLHSLNGVSDEWAEGKVTRRFKEVVLDGSLAWAWYTDFVGYKRVYVQLANDFKGLSYLIKYDGKIITKNNDNPTSGDQYSHFDTSEPIAGQLYLSISDTDSGFPEGWTGGTFDVATYTGISRSATASDMIKAYMNGWKWNSSGTGSWSPIIVYEGATTSTNVDYVVNNRYPYPSNINWQPYRLIYQLASAQQEQIPLIGDAMLTEGNNSVTLGEGLVRREAVYPHRDSTDTYSQINTDSNNTNNYTKNKIKSFVAVYKNGEKDSSWSFTDRTTSNGSYASKTERFDPTAVYTVDYIIESPLTASIQSLDAEYSKNARSTLNELVKSEAEHGQRISVIEQTYARKAQPGWITPTLLNGWVNFDSANESAGFYKDEFRDVHIKGTVKSGTVGQILFYLPKGYRPKLARSFPIYTDVGIGKVKIDSDGSVKITAGSNVYSHIDIPSFRAEQ